MNVLNGTDEIPPRGGSDRSEITFFTSWVGDESRPEIEDEQIFALGFLCICKILTSTTPIALLSN